MVYVGAGLEKRDRAAITIHRCRGHQRSKPFAAATSDVGAVGRDRMDAFILTLKALGAEADVNVVDGNGNTAFAIGEMSSSPDVRNLVKDFKNAL